MLQNNAVRSGFTKIGYWQNFIQYLSSGTHENKIKQYGLSLPKANDYNWYPIRFGNARAHIEHSFNSKNGTIRASLIIEGDPALFDRIAANKDIFTARIVKLGGALQWDSASKAQHINVILNEQDAKNAAAQNTQFAWFAAWTYEFKSIVDIYDMSTPAMPMQKDAVVPQKAALQSSSKKAADTPGSHAEPATATVENLAGYSKIMDKMAEYLGLDIDASSCQIHSEEFWAIRDSMKKVIIDIRKIADDPACKKSIDAILYGDAPSAEEQAVIDELRQIRHSSIDRPLMSHSTSGLPYVLQLLQTMNQHGVKKAAYYLARYYGSGLIGLNSDEKPFVLEPNIHHAIKLYKEALNGGCYQAALELGCIAMALHKDLAAREYFAIAQAHAIPEAEIYLNYMAKYPERENTYENYHMECHRNMGHTLYNSSRCGCNCIEYKGYLYFIEWDQSYQSSAKLRRVRITGGQSQLLLTFSPNSMMSGFFPLEQEQIFSIMQDRIYLPVGEPDAIVSLNLDGSDMQYLKNLQGKASEKISRPYAFPSFMIYQKGTKQLYRYDYQTGQSTRLTQYTGQITGVSEKEIIFDNKRVLKLDTLTKVSIQSVYPALKGKKEADIMLIDCSREIAYFCDRVQKKVFGTDKHGKIVDIWAMPRRHWTWDREWLWYDSRCFNGRRWTGKFGDVGVTEQAEVEAWCEHSSIFLPQRMVVYDRSGNTIIVYEDQKNPHERNGQYNFGMCHAMTRHMDLMLRNAADAQCWNMALNMYKPAQFIQLCRFL